MNALLTGVTTWVPYDMYDAGSSYISRVLIDNMLCRSTKPDMSPNQKITNFTFTFLYLFPFIPPSWRGLGHGHAWGGGVTGGHVHVHIQWNLGITDTQGTVQKCPEFWDGLISQVHFYVLDRPRGWRSCLNSQVVPISKVVIKTDFTVYRYNQDLGRYVWSSNSKM